MNFVYINKSFEAENSLPIKHLTDIFFSLHKVGFEKSTRKYFIVMGQDLSFEVVKNAQISYKEEHQAIKFGGVNTEGISFALLEKNLIYKVKSAHHAVAFLALFNNNQYYWSHILTKAVDKMIEQNEIENKNELNVRVYDWLNNGKINNCSLTLCKNLLNREDIEETNLPNHPRNIDDFSSCYEFLEKFPEAKAKFSKMKEVNKEWQHIVENWTSIEKEYINQEHNLITQFLDKLNFEYLSPLNFSHKIHP
jgi:hypothetical protein